MSPAAPPPRARSDRDLGFVRQPMVRWLDPGQLVGTAARVVASGFVTAYTDTREVQVLTPQEVFDRSGTDELWFDYVADLGDGWSSTYSVAYLMAQPDLKLAGHATQRGSVLVMGGDQVYPVPTRSHYENRLLGPYRAALPSAPAGEPEPELFAIPGSHDWYDGLVNFMSVFCRQRRIGGRATRQTRSYFALRLPQRWSLWAVDLQFGDYLDEGQVAYFRAAARDLEPGERIVVCVAKEVESGRRSAEVSSDRNLAYLDREVVRPAGATVALYLKSGRHHYCRYEGESAQLVTAGGGGAFLHPTHDLPELVDAPGEGPAGSFALRSVYPSRQVSRRLRKRVWFLPVYNLPLAALLGAIQVLLVFMLNLHLGGRRLDVGFGDLARALWDSPTAFALISLIILTFGAMIRLAHDARGFPRLLIALGHTLLQFGGLGLVIVVASGLTTPLGDAAGGLLAFLAVVFALGGIGGVLGVSGYLWATNCMGFHANEAFAPLHHMDQKNFLRLHVGADGSLTVYPVGIERVGRRWAFRPDEPEGSPWLAPEGPGPVPRLIEPPIVLDGGAGGSIGGSGGGPAPMSGGPARP